MIRTQGAKMKQWYKTILLCLSLILAACQDDLVNGLSQRQANEAVALLQQNQIDVRKLPDGKKGFKISVDRKQFPDAVSLLAAHQLPSRDDVTIADMFPADSLVTTPTSEKARLLSGIEQRLEQSVRSIEPVVSARVHASYPLFGVDNSQSLATMRIAILVNYEGDLSEDMFAQKIKRLTRNVFDGLAYENISVVMFKRSQPNSNLSFSVQNNKPVMNWLILGIVLLVSVGLMSVLYIFYLKKFNKKDLLGTNKQPVENIQPIENSQ